MRTAILSVVLVGVAACATPRPQPEAPKSASEHLREAARHDQEAAVHERAAAEAARSGYEGYACGDRALSDQTQTGGEPVTRWVPCWSVERDASAAHQADAERLRAEARAHRATARALVEVERTFCAIMPEDELTHTPFYHRTDVASVEAYREGDALAGARITFRPVRGLTVEWMRDALLCHRARAASLGYPATYMPYDPTTLRATHLAVATTGGAVVVTVRADDDVTAAVVWSRAQALKP